MTPPERVEKMRGMYPVLLDLGDWFTDAVVYAIESAVQEALQVGGIPGVELTAEQVEEIRGRNNTYPTPSKGSAGADINDLLSDRLALMAVIRDMADGGELDRYRQGWEAGFEAARRQVIALAEQVAAHDRKQAEREMGSEPGAARFHRGRAEGAKFVALTAAQMRPK